MLVTNSADIAEKACRLKDLSFSDGKKRTYVHSEVGYNYRMTNLQAAVGLAQLERIDDFVAMRRKNAYFYNDLLKDIVGIRLPVEKPWAKNVYWMYSVVVEPEFGLSRDELMLELAHKGVDTRAFFVPMNRQPVFADMNLFLGEGYPIAEGLSKTGLYLPLVQG